MKLCVVAVFDGAVKAFMPAFCVQTTAVAVRAFGDEVKNPQSPMSRHPEDYVLFQVGEFDDEFGIVSAVPVQQLVRAIDLTKGE